MIIILGVLGINACVNKKQATIELIGANASQTRENNPKESSKSQESIIENKEPIDIEKTQTPKKVESVDIQGEITNITPASEQAKSHGRLCTLMVEGIEPDGAEDSALVTVTDETHILKHGDQKAGLEDLKEGIRVAVKFKGPVAMSYPVLAKAGEILILEQ